MIRMALHVARPVILWAIHFTAIYALISAACAPRALLEPDVARATAALVTLVTGVLMLVWLVIAGRVGGRLNPDEPSRTLAQAAWWTNVIMLIAIVANLWPIAVMGSCTG
ncbi:hypothetical protein [Citreimonas salinaria]|uniref:Uncharacterized protein n=1 Tax=Citreimonas salinaria TaxID=321339 RepID=A0A1H3J4W6_9RHOB|nr:hypothetical protein [Citreimonas salinaria]SDY34976.1 hypothetical protein SAMN05444340_10657 [Citreimonas salinaria]